MYGMPLVLFLCLVSFMASAADSLRTNAIRSFGVGRNASSFSWCSDDTFMFVADHVDATSANNSTQEIMLQSLVGEAPRTIQKHSNSSVRVECIPGEGLFYFSGRSRVGARKDGGGWCSC